MRKLLYLFLFICNQCFGQTYLSTGIYGSADKYDFRHEPGNRPETSEMPLASSLGIQIGLTHNRIVFKTGIAVSQKNFSVNYNYTFLDPDDPAIPMSTDLKSTYLDIPITFSYSFLKNEKLNIGVGTGVYLSFRQKTTETTHYGANRNVESMKYQGLTRDNMISIPILAPIDLIISKRFILNATPAFRYYTNPYNTGISTLNSVQVSLQLGVNYRFEL
jgi:hypothetical protein